MIVQLSLHHLLAPLLPQADYFIYLQRGTLILIDIHSDQWYQLLCPSRLAAPAVVDEAVGFLLVTGIIHCAYEKGYRGLPQLVEARAESCPNVHGPCRDQAQSLKKP